MIEGGFTLGGEQSGHLIFLEEATTGDGQLAAIKFLSELCATGKRVSELTQEIPYYPQVLINVQVQGGNKAKQAIMGSEALKLAISEREAVLGDRGRILVRPSGTEPKIRVMVEADTETVAQETAEDLANLIKSL